MEKRHKALLSRTYVVSLKPLSVKDISAILKKVIATDNYISNLGIQYDDEAIVRIAEFSGGDARNALNMLEFIIQYYPNENITNINITVPIIEKEFANQHNH